MDIKKYCLYSYEFIKIRNKNFFEVTFCSLGASIYQIEYHFDLLTLSPESEKDFILPSIYHGKTIGRVAGRIKGNTLSLNGRYYRLSQNEGNNVLHGGFFGLSSQNFVSKIIENEDSVIVEYRYLSMDLESGFPGAVEVLVRYIVDNNDSIRVEYEALSDKDTILNLTNHSYFSLGSKNVYDLKLTANVNKYIYPDDKDLCVIEERNIDNKFDFSNGMKFKEHIFDASLVNVKAYGYDHMLLIDKLDDNLLKIENDKYILEINSSFNAVQIYTDNYVNNIIMKGTDEIRHRAVAIEPQNNQLSDLTLKAGQKYKQYIIYNFRRK